MRSFIFQDGEGDINAAEVDGGICCCLNVCSLFLATVIMFAILLSIEQLLFLFYSCLLYRHINPIFAFCAIVSRSAVKLIVMHWVKIILCYSFTISSKTYCHTLGQDHFVQTSLVVICTVVT